MGHVLCFVIYPPACTLSGHARPALQQSHLHTAHTCSCSYRSPYTITAVPVRAPSAVAFLQAPFCVHPKTGKVCVPIDPEAAWEFDPDDVPTVQQLLQEINEQQQQDGGASPQQQVSTLCVYKHLIRTGNPSWYLTCCCSLLWQLPASRLEICPSPACLLHAP
jgi:hypothetical protein